MEPHRCFDFEFETKGWPAAARRVQARRAAAVVSTPAMPGGNAAAAAAGKRAGFGLARAGGIRCGPVTPCFLGVGSPARMQGGRALPSMRLVAAAVAPPPCPGAKASAVGVGRPCGGGAPCLAASPARTAIAPHTVPAASMEGGVDEAHPSWCAPLRRPSVLHGSEGACGPRAGALCRCWRGGPFWLPWIRFQNCNSPPAGGYSSASAAL
jgi:hypothetical protein